MTESSDKQLFSSDTSIKADMYYFAYDNCPLFCDS